MTPAAARRARQRLTVAAVALGAGLCVLGAGPRLRWLETADRHLLQFLLARTGDDPATLAGTGGHTDARRVRGAPVRVPAGELPPPRFLAVTDDPEGIFEASPPSPADVLVVLANLRELGHRQLAVAVPLAWDDPDPIAAAAVNHQLDGFAPAVVGVPLARGISPVPPPAAFARLAVPVARIRGDAGPLPVVNQVALPNPLCGEAAALAAFTRLESETAPGFSGRQTPAMVPLLARWDDQVVVALPLGVMMARFHVGAAELVITPGRDIRLGPDGPIIPIDLHGRAAVSPGTASRTVVTPAAALIVAGGEPRPEALQPGLLPLVIRDDRSAAPEPERAYSQALADVLVALDRAPRAGLVSPIPRPHTAIEILVVGALAGLGAWLCGLRPRLRHPLGAAAVLAGIGIAWITLAAFHAASPPLALAVTPLAGWLASLCCRPTPAAAKPPAEPPAMPKPPPESQPEPPHPELPQPEPLPESQSEPPAPEPPAPEPPAPAPRLPARPGRKAGAKGRKPRRKR